MDKHQRYAAIAAARPKIIAALEAAGLSNVEVHGYEALDLGFQVGIVIRAETGLAGLNQDEAAKPKNIAA